MLNRFQGIGNLGRDPETRHTQDGTVVANFSIAVSERWKDKSGQQQERTEWINCVAWGRVAEVAAEYLRKGSKVYIEGKMKTDAWEQDGIKRYTTKIHLTPGGLVMLGGKPEGQTRQTGESSAPLPPDDDFNDDIPF